MFLCIRLEIQKKTLQQNILKNEKHIIVLFCINNCK